MSASTCRFDNVGTLFDADWGHAGEMSADMLPTCRPDNHMSVVWTPFRTRKNLTYPAEARGAFPERWVVLVLLVV